MFSRIGNRKTLNTDTFHAVRRLMFHADISNEAAVIDVKDTDVFLLQIYALSLL